MVSLLASEDFITFQLYQLLGCRGSCPDFHLYQLEASYIVSIVEKSVLFIYFVKCFKDLSCPFRGELNILHYSEFSFELNLIFKFFMNFIQF